MMCGLASNRRLKAVGLLGFDRWGCIVDSVADVARSSGNSPASTWRLETGDVLNAPRQIRNAAFYTRSSDSMADFRAEPYTTQP